MTARAKVPTSLPNCWSAPPDWESSVFPGVRSCGAVFGLCGHNEQFK
jgi:hypothetical protein